MANSTGRTNIFTLHAHRNMKNVNLKQSQAADNRANSTEEDTAKLSAGETKREISENDSEENR